jgi:hypothetical protein
VFDGVFGGAAFEYDFEDTSFVGGTTDPGAGRLEVGLESGSIILETDAPHLDDGGSFVLETGSDLLFEGGVAPTDFSTVNRISISETDVNGTSTESFLSQVQIATSAIKGHVRIHRKTYSDQYVMFTISNVTNHANFQEIEVSKIGGENAFFADDQDIVVTFARTGDPAEPEVPASPVLANVTTIS